MLQYIKNSLIGLAAGVAPLAFVYLGLTPDETKKEVQPSQIELKVEDVIGNSLPDKFYEKYGQRLYIEIDGKPAIEYFLKN